MIDAIKNGMSILIPSWNNFECLKGCVEKLKSHSVLDNQIIVHVNDGSDGTYEWVLEQGLEHTYTPDNVGLCTGINMCAELATKDVICYFNDDMFATPEWDRSIQDFIALHNIPSTSCICPMLIEGFGRNPDFISGKSVNYGRRPKDYDEVRLINDMPKLKKLHHAMKGSSWAPNLIHRDMWKKIGGFSEAFTPTLGLGSDPDFAKKLYDVGCRNFLSVPDSLVYHFGSVVNSRLNRGALSNHAKKIFIQLHGMSISDFVNGILERGTEWDNIVIR